MYMLDFIYLFKTQSHSLFDSADNPSKSHCQDSVSPLKVTKYCLLQCPDLASMPTSLCYGSALLFLASIYCTEQFFYSDSEKNVFKTSVIKSKKTTFSFLLYLTAKIDG